MHGSQQTICINKTVIKSHCVYMVSYSCGIKDPKIQHCDSVILYTIWLETQINRDSYNWRSFNKCRTFLQHRLDRLLSIFALRFIRGSTNSKIISFDFQIRQWTFIRAWGFITANMVYYKICQVK